MRKISHIKSVMARLQFLGNVPVSPTNFCSTYSLQWLPIILSSWMISSIGDITMEVMALEGVISVLRYCCLISVQLYSVELITRSNLNSLCCRYFLTPSFLGGTSLPLFVAQLKLPPICIESRIRDFCIRTKKANSELRGDFNTKPQSQP